MSISRSGSMEENSRPLPNSPSTSGSSSTPTNGEPSVANKNEAKAKTRKKNKTRNWTVYLILSSRLRMTYVGVTTDLSRRLKQHNGEQRGGAKASRAGRPWMCACIIQGFHNQRQACEFEAKWKGLCRKLPRKYKNVDDGDKKLLLRHREDALNKVMRSFNHSSLLQIEWSSNSEDPNQDEDGRFVNVIVSSKDLQRQTQKSE